MICGLALPPIQNPGYAYAICAICIPDTGRCILVLLANLHELAAYNIAKVQSNKIYVALLPV